MTINNNPIAVFKNAVIVLKNMPVSLKGVVYTDSKYISDNSEITFKNNQMFTL